MDCSPIILMETPSPTDRRQAWVRGSRHWLPLEEPDPQGSQRSLTSHTVHHGCSEGKIESWLRACGPRNKGQATSTPSQKLSVPLPHLGHSMASSGLSSMTSRTASSVTEVLQLYVEDAEDTLYQLGFGCDEPQVTARIPARFFSFPSQLRGINFRLFLESQLGRLHQEDPGLSLASRFRQVEVLTAMANAFYSLYSHVSRTPLQKLAPPDLSFSSSPVETKIGPRFFSHIRSEPKSPVERLKDTVSKMCLYTGPSLRSPDSVTSHTPLLRQCSLPDLPEAVFECAASEPSPGRDPRSNGPTSSVQRHCGLREEPVHVDLSIETLSHKSQAMGSENIVTGICPDGPGLSTSVSLHHPDFERQRSLCRITVTGWEEDVLSDGATRPAGGSTRVRGMETSPILGLQSNRSYLSPSKPPALGQALQSTQLANSFELEEVPSAGEEDPGQPESKQLKTLPLLTAVGRHRDLLIRGDSLQSDSSGYAEEDNPLPSSPKKDSC
ncbi:sperm-specific antigen 2-like [Scleropages formosus]|uniref:Sperm-specific antigen 2-like n=1 Tax=Scleropages formosus TaxID=113540 RepID=A0A0P7V3V6_SCLFO|nr:sperm-specific antigen 2-like [Scleropages formosus]